MIRRTVGAGGRGAGGIGIRKKVAGIGIGRIRRIGRGIRGIPRKNGFRKRDIRRKTKREKKAIPRRKRSLQRPTLTWS